MSLRLRNVQIDVPPDGYDEAVAFWAAALGGTARASGDGTFTHLVGARGMLGTHLQRLGSGAPRVHLDLDADDPEGEATRLVELGGTRHGVDPCIVLTDPAGNPLCICEARRPDEELGGDDGRSRLHVLVIDVSSEVVEATARFWGGALGIPAEHLPEPFDAYWRLEDVPVPGGTMRLLVQDVGTGAPPRIHPDLHVPDSAAREAEVERLADLGAEVRDLGNHPWTIMADPVGTVFCVVPDKAQA